MAVTLYLRGDQIGTYQGWPESSGNGADIYVRLNGVQALGSSTDIYRVVITQVNSGATHFSNGQFVHIYTWSEDNPEGTLVYGWLNPQHDMYQGKASGSGYQIFAWPQVFFDVNGVGSGTVQYGPGLTEPLSNQLPFNAFPDDPSELVICYAAGTGILTPRGLRPIEALQPGDKVWTREHGMQVLRWVGRRRVCALGKLAPVRIEAGVFGNSRPVLVSPQHRILVTGWMAQLHFGEDELLVAAEHLVGQAGITRAVQPVVEYLHLAFDGHEILCADGLFAESLWLGPMALNALPHAARAEILEVFPELRDLPAEATRSSARPLANRREAQLLQAS